jgi:hypothetical protein
LHALDGTFGWYFVLFVGCTCRYKLIGDTVNTASRMESTCIGGRIQISNTTYRSLISIAKNRYTVKPRGNIPVKGKGQMYTYWLEGRHGEPKLAPVPDNEFVPSAADALELDASVPPPLDVNVQAALWRFQYHRLHRPLN